MNLLKRGLCLVFLIALSGSAYGQYNLDTVSVRQVADGVTHYFIKAPNIPWKINVVEADLTNPNISVETYKGGQNMYGHGEAPNSVATKLTKEGHTVVGAINGDFYNTSNYFLCGLQVQNGELIQSNAAANWARMGFDENNKPFMGLTTPFTGTVIGPKGNNPLNGINIVRLTNYMVLYNKFMGANTATNPYGSEAVIQPIDAFRINDTIRCVVKSKVKGVGSAVINEGELVLSGHGTSDKYIDSLLTVGDTIKIATNLLPSVPKLKEMISGLGRLVIDGKNVAYASFQEEYGSLDFLGTGSHPRTGLGFSADSTKLYLVVVDGRQQGSVGINLSKLADLMIQIGVSYGMNLDGGGSSCICARNQVVNSPSDLSPRKVSNTFTVVTSEVFPLGTLEMTPDSVVSTTERNIKFKYDGYDLYGYPKVIDPATVTYSVENPEIGEISTTGLFSPKAEGITKIIANCEGIADTSIVKVEDLIGKVRLSSFTTLDGLSPSSENINDDDISISVVEEKSTDGNTSLRIDYKFIYQTGRFYKAFVDTDIPITGVPETIDMDIFTDNIKHQVAFFLADDNDEQFLLGASKMHNPEAFDTVSASFKYPIAITKPSTFNFPVRLKQIAVSLDCARESGLEYSGTIYIDNLRLKYTDDPVKVEDEKESLPNGYSLEQNYPNPFNPTTNIRFSIPEAQHVTLKIFDVLGREVATLINGEITSGIHTVKFNAANYASGLYIYRLTTDSFVSCKQMLLIK